MSSVSTNSTAGFAAALAAADAADQVVLFLGKCFHSFTYHMPGLAAAAAGTMSAAVTG
jgi:hypothetical protein